LNNFYYVELSQLRSRWKSTPNLSRPEKEEESPIVLVEKSKTPQQEKIKAKETEVDGSKPTTSTEDSDKSDNNLGRMRNRGLSGSTYDVLESEGVSRAVTRPLKRKKSALVSRWEDMIKQQQNNGVN